MRPQRVHDPSPGHVSSCQFLSFACNYHGDNAKRRRNSLCQDLLCVHVSRASEKGHLLLFQTSRVDLYRKSSDRRESGRLYDRYTPNCLPKKAQIARVSQWKAMSAKIIQQNQPATYETYTEISGVDCSTSRRVCCEEFKKNRRSLHLLVVALNPETQPGSLCIKTVYFREGLAQFRGMSEQSEALCFAGMWDRCLLYCHMHAANPFCRIDA